MKNGQKKLKKEALIILKIRHEINIFIINQRAFNDFKKTFYKIEITDLQGANVHHENHTFTNGIHKLNTSEWDSGIYILQVATDQGRKFVKVMKK